MITCRSHVHSPPFNTLPLLESHIHPKFVIYDAGFKLMGLKLNFVENISQQFSSLTSIIHLYNGGLYCAPRIPRLSARTSAGSVVLCTDSQISNLADITLQK